jgi:superfamily II DNA or RNA helicase
MAGPHTETAKAKSKDTRIVFATYSMLEEGYDDPLLDTLVLATPRSRIQQTVGRIERTHEGKLRPLVLDFVDPLALYENMWRKRLKFYRSRGFSLNSCE